MSDEDQLTAFIAAIQRGDMDGARRIRSGETKVYEGFANWYSNQPGNAPVAPSADLYDTEPITKAQRVLIFGSRDWKDWHILTHWIRKLSPTAHVCHGDARGADKMAGYLCQQRGLVVHKFPATQEEWRRYPKTAGFIRNDRMIEAFDPDFALGFSVSRPITPGSKHMLQLVVDSDVDFHVVYL